VYVTAGGTASTGITACNAKTPTAGYAGYADPVSSTTGSRYFGTNTTGTIWQHTASLSGLAAADTAGGGGKVIQ